MSNRIADQIARKFNDCTLPENEWTHEAHLIVGLWYLLQYSDDEALNQLRCRIRRYNVACGIANTDESGYHETITKFYVTIISNFLKTNQTDREDVDRLADELINELGDRELIFSYYSRERLFSQNARRNWLNPDLRPIDLSSNN